jgi:hypothetical protein
LDSYTVDGSGVRTAITPSITAKNITISKEIFEDLNCIAVAASFNTVPGDASKGLEMAGLRHQNVFPAYGTLRTLPNPSLPPLVWTARRP